jgi:hypothetical protein
LRDQVGDLKQMIAVWFFCRAFATLMLVQRAAASAARITDTRSFIYSTFCPQVALSGIAAAVANCFDVKAYSV